MHWTGWLVVALALVVAGWLAFDGTHALITGDYVTPKEGRHAGQLGPWAKVVMTVGVEPRSTWMKAFHVAFGVVWLAVVGCYLVGASWAWGGMLTFAVLSLWYVPFGTVLGLVQVVLLLLPPLRGLASG